MTTTEIEAILDEAARVLSSLIRKNSRFTDPKRFQDKAQETLREIAAKRGFSSGATFHDSAFPDLKANGFGIEVKTVQGDSWVSTGNSVFETMRDPSTKEIYVLFGKMGGDREVRWRKYEDCIVHVRISHAPRFMVDMERSSEPPLFGKGKMDISYEHFCKLQPTEKMGYIREYHRKRLKKGEALWWIEDETSPGKSIEVREYSKIEKEEQIRIRAEASLLFPRIVAPGHDRAKYDGVVFYVLNNHNVICRQSRDLFSAGSVAGKVRGGNYIRKALKNIEGPMIDAALRLDGALIEEYWGKKVAPKDRIKEWLLRADSYAKGWKPSEHLFLPAKKRDG